MRGPGRRAPVGRRSFQHSTVRAKGQCGTLRDADVVPFGTCGGQGEGKCHGAGLRSRGHRRTAGTRRAPQPRAPFGDNGCPFFPAGGSPSPSPASGRSAGRRAWRPVSYWGFAMEQGGEGGMDIIPPGWQEKAILVLPPEAKPCKSHDGGGGTAPCRGEKGGCHARCT